MKKSIFIFILMATGLSCLMSCSQPTSQDILIAEVRNNDASFKYNHEKIASSLTVFFEQDVRIYACDIVFDDGQYYLRGKAKDTDTDEPVGKVIIDLIKKGDNLYLPKIANARVCTLGNSCLKCIDNGVKCACELNSTPAAGSCYWANNGGGTAYLTFFDILQQK